MLLSSALFLSLFFGVFSVFVNFFGPIALNVALKGFLSFLIGFN